jgi:hypothetical protein
MLVVTMLFCQPTCIRQCIASFVLPILFCFFEKQGSEPFNQFRNKHLRGILVILKLPMLWCFSGTVIGAVLKQKQVCDERGKAT